LSALWPVRFGHGGDVSKALSFVRSRHFSDLIGRADDVRSRH
jgi:hypothetical protein